MTVLKFAISVSVRQSFIQLHAKTKRHRYELPFTSKLPSLDAHQNETEDVSLLIIVNTRSPSLSLSLSLFRQTAAENFHRLCVEMKLLWISDV